LEPGVVYSDKAIITPAKPSDHTELEVLIDESDTTCLMERCYAPRKGKQAKHVLRMIETTDSHSRPVRIITNGFDLTVEELGEM